MKNVSLLREEYLKGIRRDKITVMVFRFAILIFFLGIWELFARLEIIDSFITSCPSKIAVLMVELFRENNFLYHIGVTLYETIAGFLIATIIGYLIALLLWSFRKVRLIFEPYLVVLNGLPKIALGPIIIVIAGSGIKSIILMTILVCIIVAIITMLSGFRETDNDKILLLKSLGATKRQIITKLIIPSSIPTLISMLKITVGMSWIGSIMGEYLVSKAGIGYLIVYGGQVFKLDLVMCCVIVLCILATLMYFGVILLEKLLVKHKT